MRIKGRASPVGDSRFHRHVAQGIVPADWGGDTRENHQAASANEGVGKPPRVFADPMPSAPCAPAGSAAYFSRENEMTNLNVKFTKDKFWKRFVRFDIESEDLREEI